MIPVIVIRPQPGCGATTDAARAAGLDARDFPLFEIRPVAWRPPPAESFDALLLGSANALRQAGPALAAYRGKAVYAVGAATAGAAIGAGLEVAATGTGGIAALLPQLAPAHRRLLRLCGRERVMLTPPRGVTIRECVVYASEPLPLPRALATLLRRPALVLLHSAEAAGHFAGLCDTHRVDRANLVLAAIGPRVARAAGGGWAAVGTADVSSDAAMLALARELCQDAAD